MRLNSTNGGPPLKVSLATLCITFCFFSCSGGLIDAAGLLESYISNEPIENHQSNDILPNLNTNTINVNQSPDAPKYYERNSLLYKSPKSPSNTNLPLDDLKPLDGARINPKDMTLATAFEKEDDPPPIDGLIRAMRKKENPATESGVSYHGQGNKESMMDSIGTGLTGEDEASVQRKSTNIEPDSSLSSGTSSRLRRGKGKYKLHMPREE